MNIDSFHVACAATCTGGAGRSLGGDGGDGGGDGAAGGEGGPCSSRSAAGTRVPFETRRRSSPSSTQCSGMSSHCSSGGASSKTTSRGGAHVAVLLITQKRTSTLLPPPSTTSVCVQTWKSPVVVPLTNLSCSAFGSPHTRLTGSRSSARSPLHSGHTLSLTRPRPHTKPSWHGCEPSRSLPLSRPPQQLRSSSSLGVSASALGTSMPFPTETSEPLATARIVGSFAKRETSFCAASSCAACTACLFCSSSLAAAWTADFSAASAACSAAALTLLCVA